MESFIDENRPKQTAEDLLQASKSMKGAMGAIAWATLETFRRSGVDAITIQKLHEQMLTHFSEVSDSELNEILATVQRRLTEEQRSEGNWY